MTTMLKQLDDLIDRFAKCGDDPNELLNIQRDIIAVRYSLSEWVAAAKKESIRAENMRKGKLALVKLRKKGSGVSMAQATEEAELDQEIVEARGEEVMAEANLEAMRRKLEVASDATGAISMRVSWLKSQMRESHTTHHT